MKPSKTKFKSTTSIVLLAILMFLCTSSKPASGSNKINDDVKALASWMTSHFSNVDQAYSDSSFNRVNLVVSRVWRSSDEAIWLYMEMAPYRNINKPFVQRVIKLYHQKGKIYAVPFDLTDGNDQVNAWQSLRPLDGLGPMDLISRGSCGIVYQRKGPFAFQGNTIGKRCKSSNEDVTYISSETYITKSKIVNLNMGYNKDDEAVWGATEGRYIYYKAPPNYTQSGR